MTRILLAGPLLLILITVWFGEESYAVPSTTIEGVVSPGNSPGCIIDHGNVTLSGAATLLIEVAGTVACDEYDRFIVLQTLTVNGPTLEVVFLDGYQPSGGERFRVIEWGSLVGLFGTIDLSGAPLPSGLEWDTSNVERTGEIIVTSAVQATVPTPLWAIGFGFILFAALGTKSLKAK